MLIKNIVIKTKNAKLIVTYEQYKFYGIIGIACQSL